MGGLLVWTMFGALIGYLAATKRGYSVVGGVIGGAFLGLLSPLMFFGSGAQGAGAPNKKCPFCAEIIKREATVCKHCGRDIPAPAGAQAIAVESATEPIADHAPPPPTPPQRKTYTPADYRRAR